MHDYCLLPIIRQVQTHSVLQWTLQLLLSASAILVKNIEHQVILQVNSFHSSHSTGEDGECLYSLSVFQALVCVDTVLSQQCAEPQLLVAALEFLSSLGKIFVPPENQVMKPDYNKRESCLFFLCTLKYGCSTTIIPLLFYLEIALKIFGPARLTNDSL